MATKKIDDFTAVTAASGTDVALVSQGGVTKKLPLNLIPVPTATQAALDTKAPLASPAFTGTPTGITKSHVGLGNVDNTADTAKPVSAAQQSALDAKAPLVSPTFTGSPKVPTATAGDSSTQAASTAFVGTAISGLSGGSVADATSTVKGVLRLTGDLGGTAASPTVPGLASKADLSQVASLAQAGQTPSQAPVAAGSTGVGSLAAAARADHVHPSAGLFAWYGTGFDGDLVFDGTNPVVLRNLIGSADTSTTSISPSGGVYTLPSGIAARNITISAGIEVAVPQGGYVWASGTLSCPSGTAYISANGLSGSANGTAGGARPNTAAASTGAGGAGAVGAGASGSAASTPTDQYGSSTGGGGGTGSGGGGGGISGGVLINKNARSWFGRDPMSLFRGLIQGSDISGGGLFGSLTGGHGGGGGGGDGTNKGGGGGSGAGVVIVNAKVIIGNVVVRANGGTGGTPTTGNCGGGGGGAGGFAILNTTDKTAWTGVVQANGGAGGAGAGTGTAGSTGGAGITVATTWA